MTELELKTEEKQNFIKSAFVDLKGLYKNFIHWNISKIILFLYSITLAFVSIIPLIIIFLIYSYYSQIEAWMIVNWVINWVMSWNLFADLLMILLVVIFFIVYSYFYILLINVNNWYIDKNKLEYKKNDYFNFKKILKYINITNINSLILLIPIIIFAILMWILFLLWPSQDELLKMIITSPFNYFTILSIIFLILCVILFLYLVYRLIFSYFLLADKDFYSKEKSAFSYIKESFSITKKISNIFKFLLVLFLLILVLTPFYFTSSYLWNKDKLLNHYVILDASLKQDMSLLSDWNFKHFTTLQADMLKYDLDENWYYEILKSRFWEFESESVKSKINTNFMFLVLYSIFSFLFINWLFVMAFTSFYRRELK